MRYQDLEVDVPYAVNWTGQKLTPGDKRHVRFVISNIVPRVRTNTFTGVTTRYYQGAEKFEDGGSRVREFTSRQIAMTWERHLHFRTLEETTAQLKQAARLQARLEAVFVINAITDALPGVDADELRGIVCNARDPQAIVHLPLATLAHYLGVARTSLLKEVADGLVDFRDNSGRAAVERRHGDRWAMGVEDAARYVRGGMQS